MLDASYEAILQLFCNDIDCRGWLVACCLVVQVFKKLGKGDR